MLFPNLISLSTDFIIDDSFYNLITGIKSEYVTHHRGIFVNYSKILAGTFSIIYLGYKGWEMLIGDRDWEILPLLRPFAIGLVIMNWSLFVKFIEAPLKKLDSIAIKKLDGANKDVSGRLKKRDMKVLLLSAKIYEEAEEIEKYKSQIAKEEAGIFSNISLDFFSLGKKIAALALVTVSKTQSLMNNLIVSLSKIFFKVCLYLVLFLQLIFQHILVILGPLAFALSILSGYRTSYLEWIGRFISVGLYSVIVLVIARMSVNLMNSAVTQEIASIDKMLKDDTTFFNFMATATGITSGFLIQALVVGGLCCLATPVISTWIIRTSGVGSAITKMAAPAAAGKVL